MSTIHIDDQPKSFGNQCTTAIRNLPANSKSYIRQLFPIVNWLPRYNWIWLSGDLVCAITVGTIVVPQSMAYAKIANLPPQFGLYSSFVGVMIYPLLGTSKDISIGTTAIMSLMVGQIVAEIVQTPEYIQGIWTLSSVAVTLAFFSGIITLGLGVLRLGILFHFICQPAIAGFMSGSGVTIIINQLNKLLGIPGINTTQVPYLVFGRTLQGLPNAKVDAAFGLISLAWLYGIKYLSAWLTKKYPKHTTKIFFLNTSRNIVVIVFSTLISYLINHLGNLQVSPFNILGKVPSGFQNMGVPSLDPNLASVLIKYMPGVVVLLIMEHCAIATSLGKSSDYTINVNQEIIAIGLTNVFGSFFSAYPSTGAFSRTAVMSKSGSRTPLSNVFVGIIVVLAIYVFTPAFQYIPNAALAAVIMSAIPDLLTGPRGWIKLWNIHPSELLIFASSYIIALCTRIDISVYVPVGISLVIQLYRVARPKYAVLGRLELPFYEEKPKHFQFHAFNHPTLGSLVRPIGKGIICFQPQENLVFQNAAYVFDRLTDEIKTSTKCGQPIPKRKGDQPWNMILNKNDDSSKPSLQAIILDLSGVHQMDATGLEQLVDTALMAQRYAGHTVRWFIVVQNPSVRKTLLLAGFGRQRTQPSHRPFTPDIGSFSPKEPHRHTFGAEGCVNRNLEKLNKACSSEQVQTIEDVNYHAIDRAEQGGRSHTDQPVIKSDASLSSDGGSDYCYCDQDRAIDSTVAHVLDRYPYFFFSLQEATSAALEFIENNPMQEAREIIE
ncbi:sulfate transporter family-domain-containing protein [Phycomyces nitens]|nr:sulfate transporter family-domain-containing protein [Phycomyces nitens]